MVPFLLASARFAIPQLGVFAAAHWQYGVRALLVPRAIARASRQSLSFLRRGLSVLIGPAGRPSSPLDRSRLAGAGLVRIGLLPLTKVFLVHNSFAAPLGAPLPELTSKSKAGWAIRLKIGPSVLIPAASG